MRPTALLPLDPRPEVTFPVLRNGEKWIVTGLGRPGLERRFRHSDVLHVAALGFDGLVGRSVVEFAAESLGLTQALEGFGATYFRKAATPNFALFHPGKISKAASLRLQQTFDSMHSGVDQAWSTAVFEEGIQAKVLSLSAKDSQLLEARGMQIREMALWIGIPPHMVGDTSKTSFSSLEQENLSFLNNSLDPWLVAIEQEFESKLLTEAEKESDSHVIKHERHELMRADAESRASFYSVATEHGILSPNEARAREDLNPVEGGDQLFRPLNLLPLDAPPEPAEPTGTSDPEPLDPPTDPPTDPPAPDRSEDLEQSLRRLIDEVGGRMGRRLASAAKRAAKDPKGYLEIVDRDAWTERHRDVLEAALGPVVALEGAVTGSERSVSDLVRALLHVSSDALVEAAEVPADDLVGSVGRCAEEIERRTPERVLFGLELRRQ